MKKNITLILSLLVLLFYAFIVSIYYYFGFSTDYLSRISNVIKIDVRAGKIEKSLDTHGSFNGDGEDFVEISFKNDKILKEIKENLHWKKLPFDRNLKILVYGIEGKYFSYGPFVKENIIPKIKNGYYYFYDKQSEEKNAYNSDEVLSRYSFNFIICIYDEDKNIMYFLEYDS